MKLLVEIYSKDGLLALPASIRLGWSDGGKHSNLLPLTFCKNGTEKSCKTAVNTP